jgi:glycerol 2-dehydrogenase (NADP+)
MQPNRVSARPNTSKHSATRVFLHNLTLDIPTISYQVNRGCILLPKSVTKCRITDNFKVILLDADDMKTLEGMAAAGKQRRVSTPNWGWNLGFDDWYGAIAK